MLLPWTRLAHCSTVNLDLGTWWTFQSRQLLFKSKVSSNLSLFIAVSTQLQILDVCPWLLLICSLFRKQFSEAVGEFIVSGHETVRVRDTRHHTAAALVIAEDKTLKPSSSKCVAPLDVWEQAQGDRPWVAEYQSVHWIR